MEKQLNVKKKETQQNLQMFFSDVENIKMWNSAHINDQL